MGARIRLRDLDLTSASKARSLLRERLNERRPEIEEAVLIRVYGVSNPNEIGDLEYLEGLRAAVRAAVDYGIAGATSSERNLPPVPAPLLTQARVAARSGVSLDTILRRYFAGYALLGDFVIEEADEGGLVVGAALKHLLRVGASLFDRIVVAVSAEHAGEWAQRLDTAAKEHRAQLVDRLLAGERLDAADLAYEMETTHTAVVLSGPFDEDALRELAATLDRRVLLVRRSEKVLWAWLGGRRPLDQVDLRERIEVILGDGAAAAIGEPGEGIGGWRLSHRQARAALPLALDGATSTVRYIDVALLASLAQDDLLATSLRETYLTPLEAERDGGQAARETLQAYFATQGNISSAAAELGVSRQTVASRLRSIEERIGRPLASFEAEMEAAMRLYELPEASVPTLTG